MTPLHQLTRPQPTRLSCLRPRQRSNIPADSTTTFSIRRYTTMITDHPSHQPTTEKISRLGVDARLLVVGVFDGFGVMREEVFADMVGQVQYER